MCIPSDHGWGRNEGTETARRPDAARGPDSGAKNAGAGSRSGGARSAASAAAEYRRAATLARRAADAARHPAEHPPPGPFRPGVWRSPLRGLWLTSILGVVLLAGLTILAVTGLLSYAAYDPRLPGNDETPGAGLLRFYLFSWPTHPSWLYRVDQGVHITLGLALVPFVLAKLWSVLPRLFAWPPVRSLAQILERVSLIMLVGGVLFEFATGILNIQNYYVFPFSFYTAHLYGAWVFIAGLRHPRDPEVPADDQAGLRSRSLRRELRTPLAETSPRSRTPRTPAATACAPSARAPRPSPAAGLLAAIGGALAHPGRRWSSASPSAGWTRRTSLFGPRGLSATAPHYLPVNRTAASIGLTAADVGPDYRLTLIGRPHRHPDPRPGPRPAAARRGAADRLRGGLVGVRPLDRRPAGRPGPAGRDAGPGRGAGRLDRAGRGVQDARSCPRAR